jgi:hypothetical protein
VYFTVLQGRGVFTSGIDSATLNMHEGIYIKKDEIRGIKALEDLVVLGVQDRPLTTIVNQTNDEEKE